MPNMRQKTHSKNKMHKRTPSGRNVVNYKPKNPKNSKCAKCNLVLCGVTRATRKTSKAKKIVTRPFGGNLCSKCYTQILLDEIRAKQ